MFSCCNKLLFVLLACTLLISCSDTSQPSEKSNQNSEVIPSTIKSENIDFKSLFDIAEQEELEFYNNNEQLIGFEKKSNDLEARKFVQSLLGEIEEGVQRKILKGENFGLIGINGLQYCIVVDTKLPDDSIESDIRFFEVRKTAKNWSLSAVSSVWRCYKNRGHEEYSTEPCE